LFRNYVLAMTNFMSSQFLSQIRECKKRSFTK
jgi:hypothetical protein